jgi:hypothetical protein
MKLWLLILPALLLWQTGITQPKGQAALYKVTFSTGVQTDFAALGSGEGKDTSLTSRLQGTLQVMYIDTAKGKWYCYGFFPEITQSSFPLPQKEQQAIREVLRRGFYFTQYSTGRMDSLWLPNNVAAAAEHFTMQLLEYYQYYLPIAPDTGRQAELPLTDGRVLANYSSSADGSKLQLTGLTPVYENSPTGMFVRSNEYIPDVSYVFSHRRLQAIRGSVIRKAKINHKTITTLTNTFEYILQPIAKAWPVPAAVLSRSTGLKGRPFYDPERSMQKIQEDFAARSRQISIAGLLEQLQLNEERKDVNVQDKLSEMVKTCFVTGKDSLSLLREAFMNADVNGIGFKTMRTGIITASTSYAQEIVRDYIAARKTDRNAMKRILPSAGLMRTPARSLQTTLELLAFDSTQEETTRSAALLALGNIAGSLLQPAAARADSLVQRLAVFTDRSGDDMLLLSVLGNAGNPTGLPYILPLLKDRDTVVKAYAYYALRFISQPLIDSLYRQALVHEQEEDVLINVLNALFLRPYNDGLATTVYEFVGQERPEKTRLGALQVLFEWSYRQPALLEKIRAIATGNSNSAVRKTALQFLARADE